jgi:hypothetical protein
MAQSTHTKRGKRPAKVWKKWSNLKKVFHQMTQRERIEQEKREMENKNEHK